MAVVIKLDQGYLAYFEGENPDNISGIRVVDVKSQAAQFESVLHTYGAMTALKSKTALDQYLIENEDGTTMKVEIPR